LIYRLKEIYNIYLGYYNKYSFYSKIGEAAIKSLEKNADIKVVLLDVIDEAIRLGKSLETIKYFAYGSNMDEIQMDERCPSAKVVGIGKLEGYRFALDVKGVATVTKDENNCVWGIVWEICGEDIVNLDKYEGIKAQCYKHSFLPVSCNSCSHQTRPH